MNYINWKIAERSPDPGRLTAAGYNPLLASLLRLRGIDAPEAAEEFLRGSDDCLNDPMLMKGMKEAVNRIKRAIAGRERVAVYGDYDVDGITSTCILSLWLRSKGVNCVTYIPDRIEEGYGLNSAAVKRLRNSGISLLISVDCGITAVAEAETASRLGLDLIITDHHECRDQDIPHAVAVIDPKQPDCPYPYKELAGVGVALKLVCAVEGNSARAIDSYADLAAIGTVADVVALTGENRYIVRKGLEKIEKAPRPGISALICESGVSDKRINSSVIGYTLAPRLNASGRLGAVDIALKLLTTEDKITADLLAAELCELNRRRQSLETGIWDDALNMLSDTVPTEPIVLASDRWHQGVIGIAASKLAEQYYLPTVMICLDGDKGKGSCRSCGGFNLFDALAACSEHLESFGGHTLAAGLNIRRDKLESFRSAFTEYYRENMPNEPPTLACDMEICDPAMLRLENVQSLLMLEPFGSGNPRPLLCMNAVTVEKIAAIGNGRHLRLTVGFRGQSYECVYFSHTEDELGVSVGDSADIAFTPQVNDFRYRSTVQLQLAAVRPHDPRPLCEEMMSCPQRIPFHSAAPYCPDRSAFVSAWRKLEASEGRVAGDINGIIGQSPESMEPECFCICLLVFLEMGLIRPAEPGKLFGAVIQRGKEKVNLANSQVIRQLKAGYDYGYGQRAERSYNRKQ